MNSLAQNVRILVILALAGRGLVRPATADAAEAETPTAPSAAANRVLELDGRTAAITVSDSPSFHTFTNALTLEAWIHAASFYPAPGSVNSILRKNLEAGVENFFLRFRNTDGPRLVEFGLGRQLGVVRGSCDIRPDQWYHVAGTYDGQIVTILVNGNVVASQRANGTLRTDTSELAIGRGDPAYSSGEFFHGFLDEIRVWNVARSAAEIRAAMTSPLSGQKPGLVAYWTFDDGTAGDASGQRNHGRLEPSARIVEMPRPATPPATGAGAPRVEPPGRALLTPEQRVAVVEALWHNLSEIYPALEYKGIRGRDWIEPAVARAPTVRSDVEFYDMLRAQMSQLRDTHTRILSSPGQPAWEAPPVMLNEVEGRVAVIRADADTTLRPGEVLVAIDHRPVTECLAEHLDQVCNSTARGRVREACGLLLRGAPGTTVNVSVQGSDRTIRQVTLRRESRPDFWREPAISFRPLNEAIGYIRIARWTDDSIPRAFDEALEAFKDLRGIVIDVRGNGGGNDQLADQVNGRLIQAPVVSSIDFWRQAGTDEYRRTIGWVQPRGPWTYPGRVAVLHDEASMSACEHFVSGVEAMGTVLLVGTPTNGAGGGPTTVKLPDGTRVAISRALGIRANGVVFEGHGIPPHILSTPSLDDLRQGRDPALEIATKWLLSDEGVPPRVQPLAQGSAGR